MTTTIQINSRGNMTLPIDLRRAMGVEKGGTVVVEQDDDGAVVLRPAVAFPIEMYTDERIAEFDAADAELAHTLKRRRTRR
jgi:AbrB family looped-hinge helix DNA binding protein